MEAFRAGGIGSRVGYAWERNKTVARNRVRRRILRWAPNSPPPPLRPPPGVKRNNDYDEGFSILAESFFWEALAQLGFDPHPASFVLAVKSEKSILRRKLALLLTAAVSAVPR